jgi:hypothetical protein
MVGASIFESDAFIRRHYHFPGVVEAELHLIDWLFYL